MVNRRFRGRSRSRSRRARSQTRSVSRGRGGNQYSSRRDDERDKRLERVEAKVSSILRILNQENERPASDERGRSRTRSRSRPPRKARAQAQPFSTFSSGISSDLVERGIGEPLVLGTKDYTITKSIGYVVVKNEGVKSQGLTVPDDAVLVEAQVEIDTMGMREMLTGMVCLLLTKEDFTDVKAMMREKGARKYDWSKIPDRYSFPLAKVPEGTFTYKKWRLYVGIVRTGTDWEDIDECLIVNARLTFK